MKTTNPTKTVLTIATGFLIIGLFTGNEVFYKIAAGVGILGLISSKLAYWIDFLWMKLAWVLSLIVPNILLSAVFFLVLFPVALLSRLFGESDPLWLKNRRDSFFKETNKTFDPESFENPW